ncbi:MAG: hypothetical protein HY698_12825 [Deltaproteobacteria bacterium]|nr:hypothetical protein [Deltaproteobacteria bacterium]
MARRILVPVVPSERFYDAVVAAGDLMASEGGLLTFLFTSVRPPPLVLEKTEGQHESFTEVVPERGDPEELEEWQADMRHGLADARELLYERGIGDDQVNYIFADFETPTAQAITDEAAAGAYDLVVLARGYLVDLPEIAGEAGGDLLEAVQALEGDGVRLLVT